MVYAPSQPQSGTTLRRMLETIWRFSESVVRNLGPTFLFGLVAGLVAEGIATAIGGDEDQRQKNGDFIADLFISLGLFTFIAWLWSGCKSKDQTEEKA